MIPAQWKRLLASWSSEVLTTDLLQQLDPADRNLKYLGFPAASAADLRSLESRLGVTLPPSYRTFLETTDGFRVISPFIHRIRSTAEVDWFRVENQGWIETYNEPTAYDEDGGLEPSDEEYFDYSNANELDFRRTHLFAMLQVSNVDDGVMLLNPLVVTPDGEWEAWFFANWIPGAYRYASFAHMMVETYRSLRKLKILHGKSRLPKIPIPGPAVPRHSVIKSPEIPPPRRPKRKRKKGQSQIDFVTEFMADAAKEEATPAPPELVKLLNGLKDTDPKARAKTIRILQGKLKIRGMSTRHPDIVPLAAELARSLPDPESRCACISLLTNITPDGPVPAWLTTALADPHPWVLQTALYAVYYFNGFELVAPIIRILSEATDMHLLQNAANALSEIPDIRAVPALAAQLDCAPSPGRGIAPEVVRQVFGMHYMTFALALAKYGRHAVPYLLPFLGHPDPNRRIAAIVALRAIGDPGTRNIVAKLKSDSDQEVRQQAERCDHIWGDGPGFKPHTIP
jgi:HEAT repeat protein